MTPLQEARERLGLLLHGISVSGLDHLPIVSRENADAFASDLRALLDELSHLRGEVERLTGISDEQRIRQTLSTPEAARPDNGMRKCKGCGDTYHEFWGCLRSNCTGAD